MGPLLGGMAALQYSAAGVNIIFDGNSLVDGLALASPSTQGIVPQLAPLAPLNGAITIRNTGKSGQNIQDMIYRANEWVDPYFDANKKNILLAWEGTNQIFNNGTTGTTAAAQMGQYCTDRLAKNPGWLIILLTTLPRFSDNSAFPVEQGNVELTAYNDYLKANFKAMGAKKVIDVRSTGVFAYTGPTMSGAMSPYMLESTHYNAAGGALLAQIVADGLKRLPAR